MTERITATAPGKVVLSGEYAVLNGAPAICMAVNRRAVAQPAIRTRTFGITIDIVREPNDGYWSNVWLKKPFVTCFWSGRPTEDLMFTTAYAVDSPWNDTHWKNKRFNKLLVAARAELDESKRRKMYEDMQEICRNDSGTVVPMFNQMVEASSAKVAHGPISGHMALDGMRNGERWWFK